MQPEAVRQMIIAHYASEIKKVLDADKDDFTAEIKEEAAPEDALEVFQAYLAGLNGSASSGAVTTSAPQDDTISEESPGFVSGSTETTGSVTAIAESQEPVPVEKTVETPVPTCNTELLIAPTSPSAKRKTGDGKDEAIKRQRSHTNLDRPEIIKDAASS